MFIDDVLCRRDGTIKPYFGGYITETIIKIVGYKFVVDDNLVIILQHEIVSTPTPFIGHKG